MTEDIREQIDRLRRDIERHNRLYYVEAAPEIGDFEYDQLLKQLEQLEAAHPEYDSPDSPSHKVGGEPVEGFTTAEHSAPSVATVSCGQSSTRSCARSPSSMGVSFTAARTSAL